MAPAGHLLHTLTGHAAALLPGSLCPPLRAARIELFRSLGLAFRLATVHRRAVTVAPQRAPRDGQVALHLPQGVRWGRPAAIPPPPGLADSGWKGGRPRPITVMPERRAASNVWFLHHGREALCLRLSLCGAIELLRYRPLLRAWTPC